MTGSQLDILARQYLWDIGLDYAHGTGHGVGSFLNVHEGPQRISTRTGDCKLEAGMIISNEPGFYKPFAYGIRIESLVAVENHPTFEDFFCFETLSLCPIDINLIEHGLLTSTEVDWLNAYHQNVLDKLAPHLPEDVQLWLKEKTKKIEV